MGKIDPIDIEDEVDNINKVRKYKQPDGFKTQLDKVYPWDIVDHIYKANNKEIDSNLVDMKDYIYHHSDDIYYNRKVDFTSLIEDKRLKDEKNLIL